MNIKKIVTSCLLIFVFGSILIMVTREIKNKKAVSSNYKSDRLVTEKNISPRIIVYYFYGKRRCSTCLKIEKYTKDALEKKFSKEMKAGILKFDALNIEDNKNEHFVSDYKLETRTVVVSQQKDGTEINWKNLSKVWTFANDKTAFIDYIQVEVSKLMDVANE